MFEYFVGQALAGILAHPIGAKRQPGETPSQADARVAIERAKAVMAALQKMENDNGLETD